MTAFAGWAEFAGGDKSERFWVSLASSDLGLDTVGRDVVDDALLTP